MGTGRRWSRLTTERREVLDECVGQHLTRCISSRGGCDDTWKFLDAGLDPTVLDGFVDCSQLQVGHDGHGS